MAKKATTKSAAKAAPKKAPRKSTKKAPPAKVEHIEIELSPSEEKALMLADDSEEVCKELEETVTSAITQAVRKVFKNRKVALTAEQAEKVALILFGDSE